jgi:D-amino-acid dehydrogenase
LRGIGNAASPVYVKPRLSWELLDWSLKFWRAATPEHVRRAGPLLRDLSFASRACFEEVAALPECDFGLVKNGLLMLCRTRHALDEEIRVAARARALGMDADVLDAEQAAALDPAVRMDIAGAIHYPGDCHLAPDRYMMCLQERVAAAGVNFVWNTEVTGWRVERERHIRAIRSGDGGEIEADEFVLCGGSWSPSIVRGLGLRIPIQAGKGYSLTLAKPRELPNICAILSEARVAVTPMGGRLRFGGTMEMSGLNQAIDPVRVRAIIDSVPIYYPAFEPRDFDGVAPWCGLRPCSPDGLPYVGRSGRYANLAVAAGHAMMGLSLGPITGRIIAEILAGEKSPFDLAQLSPDRYQ